MTLENKNLKNCKITPLSPYNQAGYSIVLNRVDDYHLLTKYVCQYKVFNKKKKFKKSLEISFNVINNIYLKYSNHNCAI